MAQEGAQLEPPLASVPTPQALPAAATTPVHSAPAPQASLEPKAPQAPLEPKASQPATVGRPEDVPSLGLSKEAVNKRLRRIFTPRSDGTYQVSADFVQKYLAKGEEREKLLLMFEKCDYNPEDWLQQLLYIFSF